MEDWNVDIHARRGVARRELIRADRCKTCCAGSPYRRKPQIAFGARRGGIETQACEVRPILDRLLRLHAKGSAVFLHASDRTTSRALFAQDEPNASDGMQESFASGV